MDYFAVSRVIHILAVVIWIGGVAMVTMVILPAVKKMKSKENRINTFELIEGKFANIAKVMTALTALSGFYMMYYLNAWNRYLDLKYWWIHAMTFVWIIFSIVLFILEPLVLHKVFKTYGLKHPEKTFKIMHIAHWILLSISLLTIIGAVAGSHGLFLF